MRLCSAIAIGVVASFLLLVAIIAVTPPMDDFHPDNPYWNGLSEAEQLLGATVIDNLESTLGAYDPESTTLLIIGPSEPFTQSEAEAIGDLVFNGGKVVLMDEFGTANQLLEKLGLNIYLNGSRLIDPLYKEKSEELPKAEGIFGELVLNYATVIEGEDFETLASSSIYSYLDLNQNCVYDPREPAGPFPVAVKIRLGGGELWVISDSSVFINSMLQYQGNQELLLSLSSEGRTILIDKSHWTPSFHAVIRNHVSNILYLLFTFEIRYTFLLGFLVIIAKVPLKCRPKPPSPVETVLKKHPDWDKRLLEKLNEEMENAR